MRAAALFRGALFITLLNLPFFAACDAPAARPEHPPSAVVSWRAIGTWSGRGNSQTESFTVETGALRLRWVTSNDRAGGSGTFRVSLHSAISGRPLQMVVDHKGTGKDTAFFEDDPRVSYLVIESSDVDWTATLEEAVLGKSDPDDRSRPEGGELGCGGAGP